MVSAGKRMWKPMLMPNCARARMRASSMVASAFLAI
jgi:hypothetical protein